MKAFSTWSPGYTLVEMAISVVITAVILGTAISPVLNAERSWNRSQESLDITQNTRAALEMMVRDLRMAGSGVGGTSVTTGGVPGNRMHVLEPGPALGNPDTLHILASLDGVRSFISVSMPSASSILRVDDESAFKAGDLIVVSGRSRADLFEVTSVNSQPKQLVLASSSPYNRIQDHDLWPAGGYPVGSRVSRVERVSYWVDEENGVTRLYRRVNSEAPVPIACGVDDLAVRYILQDGSTTDSPDDPDLIRSVELEYAGRVDRKSYGTTGLTDCRPFKVQIQPRVLGT